MHVSARNTGMVWPEGLNVALCWRDYLGSTALGSEWDSAERRARLATLSESRFDDRLQVLWDREVEKAVREVGSFIPGPQGKAELRAAYEELEAGPGAVRSADPIGRVAPAFILVSPGLWQGLPADLAAARLAVFDFWLRVQTNQFLLAREMKVFDALRGVFEVIQGPPRARMSVQLAWIIADPPTVRRHGSLFLCSTYYLHHPDDLITTIANQLSDAG